jgi:hypothetical protein
MSAEALRDETMRSTVCDEPTFSLSNPPAKDQRARRSIRVSVPIPRAIREKNVHLEAPSVEPAPPRAADVRTSIRRAADPEPESKPMGWPVVVLFWAMSLLGALSAIGVAIAFEG